MNNQENYDMTKKPEIGCYLYGFFVEGASWNSGILYILYYLYYFYFINFIFFYFLFLRNEFA
jgi:hypothetical protein